MMIMLFPDVLTEDKMVELAICWLLVELLPEIPSKPSEMVTVKIKLLLIKKNQILTMSAAARAAGLSVLTT